MSCTDELLKSETAAVYRLIVYIHHSSKPDTNLSSIFKNFLYYQEVMVQASMKWRIISNSLFKEKQHLPPPIFVLEVIWIPDLLPNNSLLLSAKKITKKRVKRNQKCKKRGYLVQKLSFWYELNCFLKILSLNVVEFLYKCNTAPCVFKWIVL